MENHPIPQDVTGFKFKLIGSITIKQFGYMVLAGILSLIVYLLPLPIYLTVPLIGMFIGLSLGLAFVPIEGRPMDVMIINFAKALPAENRYVYHKRGVNLNDYEIFRPLKVVQTKKTTPATNSAVKKQALASALRNSYFRPDKDELSFFQGVKSAFDAETGGTQEITSSAQKQTHTPNPSAKPVLPPKSNPVPLPVAPAQQPESARPVIKTPIQADLIQTAPPPVQKASPTPPVAQPSTPYIPPPEPPQSVQKLADSSTVKSVEPDKHVNAGFPILPDIPNIVLGIVRDPRGKVLPNILVEVLDKNDIPVRAFKTNPLGQFSSATPLPNGTYKVFFEDQQKKNEFQPVEIEMTGTGIFQPLEVNSVDQREKLRQELFGAGPVQTPPNSM